MRLGVMQPYFFPYIGYFDLIWQTDRWIVFDTAQYIQQGWVNRNRVLHPQQGWQYILVPLQRHHHETPIKDIRIAKEGKSCRWRNRILGQLQHYRKKAPFFDTVLDMVSDVLSYTDESLTELNVQGLSRICAYLEIPFDYSLMSEMSLALGPVEGPGDWSLRISEALGASEYINPPGGAHLFELAKFEEAGIKLTIQTPVDFVYECPGYEFEPNLSIIDVMMWNSAETIRSYLASRSIG